MVKWVLGRVLVRIFGVVCEGLVVEFFVLVKVEVVEGGSKRRTWRDGEDGLEDCCLFECEVDTMCREFF